MQTTTSKCPTRAVAMTVAIAKLLPAAIAEPPSAAVPQRAAVVGLLPVAAPAVEEIPPVAVQQPAVGIAEPPAADQQPPAAIQQPAVAVPQPADGIQQAAAVVVGFHPMAAADRPFIARPMAAAWPLPFLWPPPVTWLPAMDQDDRIWQQQQQQHVSARFSPASSLGYQGLEYDRRRSWGIARHSASSAAYYTIAY